jgi:hypothetical protein
MIVQISSELIIETISKLQVVGASGREFMVFWLGTKMNNYFEIREVYIPHQLTSRITIKIPEKGMKELFVHLRATRYILVAQVHIHPKLAFHSEADDFMAILRHENALSLVLPWFGLKTTLATFFEDTVCYTYTSLGRWEETNIKDQIKVT